MHLISYLLSCWCLYWVLHARPKFVTRQQIIHIHAVLPAKCNDKLATAYCLCRQIGKNPRLTTWPFIFWKQSLHWPIENQIFNCCSMLLGVRKVSRLIVQRLSRKIALSEPIGWSLLVNQNGQFSFTRRDGCHDLKHHETMWKQKYQYPKALSLKPPITTTADDKFCNIFHEVNIQALLIFILIKYKFLNNY